MRNWELQKTPTLARGLLIDALLRVFTLPLHECRTSLDHGHPLAEPTLSTTSDVVGLLKTKHKNKSRHHAFRHDGSARTQHMAHSTRHTAYSTKSERSATKNHACNAINASRGRVTAPAQETKTYKHILALKRTQQACSARNLHWRAHDIPPGKTSTPPPTTPT